MVLGGTSYDDPLQRYVSASIGRPARRHHKTAWLLAQKSRRTMVDPNREPLEGVVEVDQAEISLREGDGFFEPGNAAKILVIGAVEVIESD